MLWLKYYNQHPLWRLISKDMVKQLSNEDQNYICKITYICTHWCRWLSCWKWHPTGLAWNWNRPLHHISLSLPGSNRKSSHSKQITQYHSQMWRELFNGCPLGRYGLPNSVWSHRYCNWTMQSKHSELTCGWEYNVHIICILNTVSWKWSWTAVTVTSRYYQQKWRNTSSRHFNCNNSHWRSNWWCHRKRGGS